MTGMCCAAQSGNTALKLASYMGHAEVAQLLIAAGANKDTSDNVSDICI